MVGQIALHGGSVAEHLAAHGVKPTRQRVMIARVLFERAQHVTAEELLDRVSRGHGHVAKATVYNTLNLFVRQGLVREVLVDRERTFYDTNTAPHHHLFCEDDGALTDVSGDTFEVRGSPDLPDGIEVVGTEVIVRVRRNDR
ncbi:MAG: Fur family transcriptional regulator [Gammaproteobacteria bacterium]|nr:Fur family transcriptional regulator [Gammaproteobacteria bacterium]